jgi:hypothetical protein
MDNPSWEIPNPSKAQLESMLQILQLAQIEGSYDPNNPESSSLREDEIRILIDTITSKLKET